MRNVSSVGFTPFVAANGDPVCFCDTKTCALFTKNGRVPVRVSSNGADKGRTALTFTWDGECMRVIVKM
jgi:hypothetical protein